MNQTRPTSWVPLANQLPKGVLQALPIRPKQPSDLLHLSINLAYRDPAAIQRFVDTVSNPKSANYRHFLRPADIGVRFGQPQTAVQKVAEYLASNGMRIKLVGKNRLTILADATVTQAENAFQTSIEEYMPMSAVGLAGQARFSFTTPPCVPSTIAGYVNYIGGLESFTRPTPQYALTPGQIRQLYSVASIYDAGFQGQGRTIAISSFDGYRLSNVALEVAEFGLPTPSAGVASNITIVPIDGQDGGTAVARLEGDLDIQVVLAMAPLCNLIIYDDGDGLDLLGELAQEADDDVADIISESYGWDGNAAFNLAAHNLHLAMSAQGITYVAASGDFGTAIAEAPYPAIDPEVLIVGGTTVVTDAGGGRISEVAWLGSGGGWAVTTDPFNIQPPYQVGIGVPTNIPYRLVPDIAFDANPGTGYQVFVNGNLESGVGGTSCACPTFASSLADCEQQIIAKGGLPADIYGRHRFGRIQDLIYSFNGDSNIFYDVVSGTNGTLPNGNASIAGPGWDTVTGWGPMIFSGFVTQILSTPVPLKLTISPASVTGGTPCTGTILLATPAPAGGLQVTLNSDNVAASLPSSVTVAGGDTLATFPISTSGSTLANVTITATAQGLTQTATLVINPANQLASLDFSLDSVIGGKPVTGTIRLLYPAPPYGLTIALSSSSLSATLPATVTVGPTATKATFPISTSGVSTAVTANITGTLDGQSVTAPLVVTPPQIAALGSSPSTLVGGNTGTATVNFTGPVGASGMVLSVTVDLNGFPADTVVMPTTVTVPGGANSVTFAFSTSAVSTVANLGFSVSEQGSGESFGTNLTLIPASISTVVVSPKSVIGGSSATATVTMTGPAGPGGMSVTLKSSLKGTTIASTVVVPSGSSTTTFQVGTPVEKSASITVITATLSGTTVKTSLPILPATLTSLSISPTSLIGGNLATGTVALSGAAPVGGLPLQLSSSSSYLVVPTSVKVPSGATSATFTVTTKVVTNAISAKVTAKQGTTAASASISLDPLQIASFSITPPSVKGGSGSVGVITLNAPVGAGVKSVSIKVSTASKQISCPTIVNIPTGASSASFKISTKVVKSGTSAAIVVALGASIQSASLAITP